MKRTARATACAITILMSWSQAQALSLFATIGDWSCSAESERLAVASTLMNVAGQSRPELNETFFMSCIEGAALQHGRFEARTISDVARGCVLMELAVFSESG